MAKDPFAEPHSAAYFNAQRDFWWNSDYLRLVAERLVTSRVSPKRFPSATRALIW